MKTINGDMWQVAGGRRADALCALRSCRASTLNSQPSTLNPFRAFTLIELLVVMGIIAALAGMLLAVVGAVKKKQYIYNTRAEMAQLEAAIERYKAAYGVYPPSNPNNPVVNQLYYELTGTTNIGSSSAPVYQSLDGKPPTLTGGAGGNVQGAFGVDGFVNCSRPGGGEDASQARNFLPDLKPKQIAFFTNSTTGAQGVNLLTASVGGPDDIYRPLGLADVNPWRYNSASPTNNPGSYDLWIQLEIGPTNKINLICNWSKQVQIGISNLP